MEDFKFNASVVALGGFDGLHLAHRKIMEKTKKLEKKDGFMKGVMALMFSQVIIKLLGLVSKIFLTNKEGFGDVGNGIYGSGYQIYAMLLTISSIGVPNAISKLISEKIAVDDYKSAQVT